MYNKGLVFIEKYFFNRNKPFQRARFSCHYWFEITGSVPVHGTKKLTVRFKSLIRTVVINDTKVIQKYWNILDLLKFL